MKVVIFSGGRGSSALTVGLRNSLSKEKTSSITNVTNAYDDGKSTGEIRRVFSNNILGPSDVRKLHEVQWEAYGKDRNVDKFFDYRIKDNNQVLASLNSIVNSKKYNHEINSIYSNLPLKLKKITKLAIQNFINNLRKNISFEDFAFSNLVYGSLSHLYGDMQEAENKIRECLGLQDAVLLNSSENKFLFGLAESGELLHDESSIVSYQGLSPIYEVFLTDKPLTKNSIKKIRELKGLDKKKDFIVSMLDSLPRVNLKVEESIKNADLIIYSSGTQYSSLYPTYLTKGLSEAIFSSKALKVFLTNIVYDNEIPGFTAADQVVQAVYYLNRKNTLDFKPKDMIDVVVANDPSNELDNYLRPNKIGLNQLGINEVFIRPLEKGTTGLHQANKLSRLVAKISKESKSRYSLLENNLNKCCIAFDLDDTLLADRRELLAKGFKGSRLNADKTNLNLILETLERGISVAIVSGNDFDVIKETFINPLFKLAQNNLPSLEKLAIYANGCCSLYKFSLREKLFLVEPKFTNKNIIEKKSRNIILAILKKEIISFEKMIKNDKNFYDYYDKTKWNFRGLDIAIKVRDQGVQVITKPIPSYKHMLKEQYKDYREMFTKAVQNSLKKNGLSKFEVFQRGWGTVEIQLKGSSKTLALSNILKELSISSKNLVFFGNEFDETLGNDFSVLRDGFFTLAISDKFDHLEHLPNLIVSGVRGTASTSFHMSTMLEMHENELSKFLSTKEVSDKSLVSLYINSLKKAKLLEQIDDLSRKGKLHFASINLNEDNDSKT